MARTTERHVTISVRVPAELDESFTHFAKEQERNRSEQIRYLMRTALESKREPDVEVAQR